MYDPTIGRWIQEDPIGFDAGQSNLYEYVGNHPVDAIDPSGLAQYPDASSPANLRSFPRPLTTWHDWFNLATTGGWWNLPRQIRSPAQRAQVQGILDNLAGTYGLNIPWVDPSVAGAPQRFPGREVPEYQHIQGPNTLTPAQRARINIRANLLSLKQDIVNRIYTMLVENPPLSYLPGPAGFAFGATGVRLNRPADYAQAANETADLLIRVTDRFLLTHNARPRLGSGGLRSVRDHGGTTREDNPWCADWAEAMNVWIQNWLRANPDSMANRLLQFQWVQYRGDFQHNFIAITPKNYSLRYSPPGATTGIDPVVTIFDPWRDIMPRVYGAVPGAGNYPTDVFLPGALEERYYR